MSNPEIYEHSFKGDCTDDNYFHIRPITEVLLNHFRWFYSKHYGCIYRKIK